jgi:hypothetical protein
LCFFVWDVKANFSGWISNEWLRVVSTLYFSILLIFIVASIPALALALALVFNLILLLI